MKHLDLFAGIGGFRKAVDLVGKDFKLPVECVGYSEIDQYAIKTYESNYNTIGETKVGDIVEFTAQDETVESLPNIDLVSGGFPCQSFSMMGKQKGFSDIRGNVFFNIIKIIKKKKPKFILLENVKNLITHDNGNTIKVIEKEIRDAGYNHFHYDIFNTVNFGLAQKRNRAFIFATNVEMPKGFLFSEKLVTREFNKIKSETSLILQENVLDVLEKEVETKYYLSDILKPTILSNGSKNFKSNSEINQIIARPLTATMVKMHRACQDNYYSDDFIKSENPFEYLKQSFTKEEQAKHDIRKITPKEAFLLQGFDESFVENAIECGISNHQLYKQAGNAVSVNTVYAILHYLFISNNLKNYVL